MALQRLGAVRELALEEVVGFERLGKSKHMLLAVSSLERASDLFGGGLDTAMAKSRESMDISLARHDRAQDLHAGHAGDVRDRLVQLNVHLFECLVQVPITRSLAVGADGSIFFRRSRYDVAESDFTGLPPGRRTITQRNPQVRAFVAWTYTR